MGKFYSPQIVLILLLITASLFNQSRVLAIAQREERDTAKIKAAKITDTRAKKPVVFNAKPAFTPFKPFVLMGNNNTPDFQQDTSTVLNVKVYPIPVSDQVNVSYHLNRDSKVTITIESIIGSKLFTLFSQRMPAGQQKNSFSLGSRLISGPYLLRVFVGNQQPVTKRILVQ
jgi:hypothetical protein